MKQLFSCSQKLNVQMSKKDFTRIVKVSRKLGTE